MRWLSAFKKKSLDPINFSVLKTDIHSHLIPEIDDGAKSIEDSFQLISGLKEMGFSRLITTPHIMSDYYNNNPKKINDGLKDLTKALKVKNLNIEMFAAAEYYVDYEFERSISNKGLLGFGDNNILIEFSFLQEPVNLEKIIFDLQINGYNVVLAHPERYLYYSMTDLERLVNRGVLLQMNLLSITGYYSPQVKKNAANLIEKNLISFVGTDCHNIIQLERLKDCFTSPLWHKLLDSGRLLNHSL